MTIAIDFDNTWTADPALFGALALMAVSPIGAHQVIIATSRHPENSPITQEERDRYRLYHWIPVVYCHGTYKQTACEKAGYKVDIWIDDVPGMIQPCKVLEDDL
jgi:NAD-dependent SIR2 family protein deacetylase